MSEAVLDLDDDIDDLDDYDRSNSKSQELSRLIRSQTDTIHQRVTETLEKILNDHKKDFKKKGIEFDVKTVKPLALAFKSLLWEKAKKENENVKSALDLSVTMEKLAEYENIVNIPVADVNERLAIIIQKKKERDQKLKEREKNQDGPERPASGKKKRKSTISDTSSFDSQEVDEKNISETSF